MQPGGQRPSSSGCTHTYGVIWRSCVSLIMCTGGAYRPFLHDLHFSAASSFQIGVLRGRRIASSGMLASVSQRWHLTCKPAVSAVEALRDGRRRLRRPTEGFHLNRPCFRVGAVGLTGGFGSALARPLRAYLRGDDPAVVNHLTRLRAHGGAQRPLPSTMLRMVASGERQGPAAR
jgi:hypothetical protein